MQTYQQLIARRQLRMTTKFVDGNPAMEGSANMDNWRCVIRNDVGVRRTVIFSMGAAHMGRPPELADVLDCLASDALGSDASFYDWCSEYGYSEDSRKALKTYRACQRNADKLKALLGADYTALLYETKRL